MEEQKKVWDEIAEEWNEFKKIPSVASAEFVARQKGNFLDFGSGSGRHLAKIKDGKYFLLDFSKKMLGFAGEKAEKLGINYELIHSSMEEIPKPDEFFDGAISVSSLHCVASEEKRKKAIEELFRVLKPGAEVYVGVWNFRSKRFNPKKGKERMIGWTNKGKRYYYLYDEEEIHEQFREAGFEIVSTHNSEMMINFIARKPVKFK